MDQEPPPRPDVIVIKEDRRLVHGLYGFFLLLVVGGAWAVLTFIEQPPDVARENRIALLVVAGLFSTAIVARWIYEARHPARLEISRDRIAAKRRGRQKAAVLQRTTGELSFGLKAMMLGGHGAVASVLRIPNSDQEAIGVMEYDRRNIRQACESLGWRFVD
ncbi:MAG: hypothetical protein M3323_05390 [Actinomycetota bacterium]|nr:hypothetical protein [Actinomycetota bacterium]